MSTNLRSTASIDSSSQSDTPIAEGDDQRVEAGWARFGFAVAWLALRQSACGVGTTVELWDVLLERRENARRAARAERSRAA